MDNSAEPNRPPADATLPPPPVRGVRTRLPSFRVGAALAVAMLTIGVGVGAAIGPTPATSLAGSASVVQQLPALVASLAARNRAQTPATTSSAATVAPPEVTPQPTPAAAAAPAASTTTSAPATTQPAQKSEKKSAPTKSPSSGSSKLPAVTSVWLIELAGSSFAEPISSPTAAPYISGQLIPKGTLLSEWSALSASAFASDAALVEHKATVGGTPPMLHTIVQPACPEATPPPTCLPGTPGGLSAADQFLQATLATITNTTTYAEHGLVVVTFATVADPASAELPAGSAATALSSQPPAGAVLLSPFAKAGARSSVTFNPISPMQSLEKLLR